MESLLANADYNEDKKFYYQKFCEAVLDTREKLANLAVEKLQKDEEEFLVNSKTYKVKRKSSSPEKGRSVANSPTKSVSNTLLEENKSRVSSPETWRKTLKSKGCFYFENNNIISHHYIFNVKTKSRHQISVQVSQAVDNKMIKSHSSSSYRASRSIETPGRWLMWSSTCLTKTKDLFAEQLRDLEVMAGGGRGSSPPGGSLSSPSPRAPDCPGPGRPRLARRWLSWRG